MRIPRIQLLRRARVFKNGFSSFALIPLFFAFLTTLVDARLAVGQYASPPVGRFRVYNGEPQRRVAPYGRADAAAPRPQTYQTPPSTAAAPSSASSRANQTSDSNGTVRLRGGSNVGASGRASLSGTVGSTIGETPSSAGSPSARGKDSFLHKTRSGYDFLQIVSREGIDAVVNDATAYCVVLPHKNFIFAPPSDAEKSKKEDSEPTTARDDATAPESENEESALASSEGTTLKFASTAEREAPLPDDYVVFKLTNLEPDETALLDDSANGRWDDVDLLNAALVAEGLATREKRARYASRFETLAANLLQQTNKLTDDLMKTEKVYTFLHSRALYSKYDLNCSSVAASLDSGVFNCVSATVLFNCFASRVGLKVAALETTGHAKSRVKFEDSYLDLETTCTNWNRLPDRMRAYSKPLVDPSAESSGGAPLASGPPATLDRVSYREGATEDGSTSFALDSSAPLGYSFTRSRRPMREITDVELVATIYYNVGVDYYQNGEYERAIASYVKAAQLAPNNKTILGNLKATLNNWAIDAAMKDKEYSKAIQITDLGRLLDPDFNEFKTNMPIFFHDWIEYLAKDNKWDEIERVQEEYWKRYPEKKKN